MKTPAQIDKEIAALGVRRKEIIEEIKSIQNSQTEMFERIAANNIKIDQLQLNLKKIKKVRLY